MPCAPSWRRAGQRVRRGSATLPRGGIVCDWTGIDRPYDDLRAEEMRRFATLGFTPHASRTSDRTIFCAPIDASSFAIHPPEPRQVDKTVRLQ